MTERSSIEQVFRDIEENYNVIKENIEKAACAVGTASDQIRFMAVTKTVQPIFINHALSLGIELIGENKVQELLEKKPLLNGTYSAHLIGHLQTNKVKKIIHEVSMIQSVDSVRLATEISKQATAAKKTMDVLLEINIASEESKTGFLPRTFTEDALQISEMPSIRIRGLMAVPPVCDTAAEARTWFSAVRSKYEELKAYPVFKEMDVLSMGMSSDYEQAILEGANLIRVGSALFGNRRY